MTRSGTIMAVTIAAAVRIQITAASANPASPRARTLPTLSFRESVVEGRVRAGFIMGSS
jgi:hypothetical protein